jgi:glutamine cyclotransferase
MQALRSFVLTLLLSLFGAASTGAAPNLTYTVVARYAHPDIPFTQGLELDGNTMYESSGLYRQSFISRWHLGEQNALDKRAMTPDVFAEGLTLFGQRLYVLSWKEQRATVFDKATLNKIGEFTYSGEGWGLTHDNSALIMSDGSATLRWLDPTDFRSLKNLTVSGDGQPVENLNELEWIPARAGQPARILANIWQTNYIVAIDPDSGNVTARLDLSQLYPRGQRSAHADVLNGIAFDPRDNTLLITGKFWPSVFRLRLDEPIR